MFVRLHLDPLSVDGGSTDDFPIRGNEGTTVSEADSATTTEHVSNGGQGGGGDAGAALAPADPNVGAGGLRAAQPAQGASDSTTYPEGWESVRDSLANRYGLRLPETITNDEQALAYLVQQSQQAQRADYYAQLGRALAPEADRIQSYLQQTKAQAQPQQSEWAKPAFDQRWLGVVERDEASGLFVGKPGTPHEIVKAVNDYARWYQRVQEDPEGYQDYLFESKYAKRVQELVQQQRQEIQREAVVNDILRQNSSWLYAKDDSGQVVYRQDGRPALSPAGVRYTELLREAQQYGISDPRNSDAYARRILSAEAQAQAASRTQPAPTQTRQAVGQPNRNPAGTMPAQDRLNNPASPDVSGTGLSLRDQMMRSLADVPDSDFSFGV